MIIIIISISIIIIIIIYIYLTLLNNIAIQGTTQVAVDKEAIAYRGSTHALLLIIVTLLFIS